MGTSMAENGFGGSPQLDRVLEALRSRGLRPRQAGGEWLARCPAHDDADASLSVADGSTGVVACCHAGCDFEAIAAALGIAAQDWFHADRRGKVSGRGQPVASYAYRDGATKLRYRLKRFSWTRKGKAGLGGLKPNDLLFGEELLLGDEGVVAIVEGEKACLKLREFTREHGWPVVVASAGGAGWRPTRRVVELFRGRRVLLWPDADGPGSTWAQHLAGALNGVAHSVEVVIIPDVPLGFDAADFRGSWSDLKEQHVYGPEAIPATVTPERPTRFVSVCRGLDDLAGLTPHAFQAYWALVVHAEGGIVRAVRTTARGLVIALGYETKPQNLSHASRALGDLERRGLIVRDGDWVYVRRSLRFPPLKGGPVAAAKKFLPGLPATIQAAIIQEEPSLLAIASSSFSTESLDHHGRDIEEPQREVDTSTLPGGRGGRDVAESAEDSEAGPSRPETLPGGAKGRTGGRTGGRTDVAPDMAPQHDGRRGAADLPFDATECHRCGRDSCDGSCRALRAEAARQ
jgi:hypothetical protein